MPPLAALGHTAKVDADAHGCPACPHPCSGPLMVGSPTVLVNGKPAGQAGIPFAGVHAACCGPNTWMVPMGSPTVLINGKPAVRKDDVTQHCGGIGAVTQGSLNVFADGL